MNRLGTLVFLASTSAVMAHPGHVGHGATGFESGFVHPITGLDHLLAILAIGLWASQLGGRSRWMVPVAFLGAMLVGGLLGMFGVVLPMVEPAILVSVLVLGILLLGAFQVPVIGAVALAVVIAMMHGFAHGADMPFTASAAGYFPGFLLSSAALAAVGFGLGIVLDRFAGTVRVARFAGLALVVGGLGLIVS